MTPQEQTTEFKKWLEERYPRSRPQVMAGASNLPFAVGQGFRIGIFNLDSFNAKSSKEAGAVVLGGRLTLPGDCWLNIALVFRDGAINAIERRIGSFERANNVRLYLHAHGAFLVGKGDVDTIDPDAAEVGEAIPISEAVFADVTRAGQLPAVAIAYIDSFRSLLGPVPLVRLGATTVGGAALDPSTIDVNTIVKRVRDLGGVFSDELLQRYHVALNHLRRKHFVLLTGISGTGKTLLAKAYAYAILGLSDLGITSQDVHLLAVRPDWTEPSHLLGYLDAITGSYSRTRFIDAVLHASENPHRPVFVTLDEMNLAQPEHYFADIMSAMETGEALVLHSADAARAGVPQRVPWPNNLYITGTVNVDETTRPFSPKLLDRAQVIDMSQVDLRGFVSALTSRQPELAASLSADVVTLLDNLRIELEPYALHFGNRVIEEIARFVAFSERNGVLSDKSLDMQIEQKILTKVRGGREQGAMLDRLAKLLAAHPVSLRTVTRMRRDLETYDSFQYWS
jgi:MoxR-like ATPase